MEVPVTLVPLASAHWDWVAHRASPVLCKDTNGFVALRGERIVGAVIFDRWSHSSCHAHLAVEDPKVTRRLIRTGFDFVFRYSDRSVIVATIPSNKKTALRLNKGIGFRELCRIRDGIGLGIGLVILEMRRENCRWVTPELRKAA